MDNIKIVFVCLGNYCRSPMAEAIFKHIASQDGKLNRFEISSAGTKDWDIGLRPDFRARQVLAHNDIPLDPHKRAQMISDQDLHHADYVIAMSDRIVRDLGAGENIFLLMGFVEDAPNRDIPDPYPTDTFPQAFRLIKRGVEALYTHLKENHFDPSIDGSEH